MSETLGSTAFYLAFLTKGKNKQWKWDRGLKTDCSNFFSMFFLGKNKCIWLSVYDEEAHQNHGRLYSRLLSMTEIK